MSAFEESKLRAAFEEVFIGIDENILEYFVSILQESDARVDEEYLTEHLAPFIESYGLVPEDSTSEQICGTLSSKLASAFGLGADALKSLSLQVDDMPKLLEKSIQLSELSKTLLSENEQATVDNLWGFNKIRNKKNDVFEAIDPGSAKYERKAQREQKKFLTELDTFKADGNDIHSDIQHGGGVSGEEDHTQISTMVLPDFSGNSREKDIHVHNFNITFGGQILLDCADLRIVYGKSLGILLWHDSSCPSFEQLLKHFLTLRDDNPNFRSALWFSWPQW